MSQELAELLDLPLAWSRVKDDLRNDRVFVQRPFEQALVESDLANWLAAIRTEIERGEYAPAPLLVVEVPKGKGAVRPGTYLRLEDQVVYTAAVGACVAAIRSVVERKGRNDFSYGLTPPDSRAWLKPPFKGWDAFREASLRRIRRGASWVVIGDVAGCYESIALRILTSDLQAAGAPQPVVKLLSSMLSRWAVHGRGVPQGFSASDILAKLYLTRIDEALRNQGLDHLRYVDDFRLFCTSRAEGKKALILLTRQLRVRGLHLQAAKTDIYRGDQAQQIIDGVSPTLKPLKKRYILEVAKAAGRSPKYLTLREAEELQRQLDDDFPLTVLRQAYQDYFAAPEGNFNKSLFHFLLNRLGAAGDPCALEHSLSLLEEHPEETGAILKYAGLVSDDLGLVDETLTDYLESEEAVYQYQRYQIIAWRVRFSSPPTPRLLDLVRAFGRDGGPEYVRAACWHFICRFGTAADLDLLEQEYPQATSPIDRSELLCCLARMEPSRRNGLLGHAKKDGVLESRAVALVISGKV